MAPRLLPSDLSLIQADLAAAVRDSNLGAATVTYVAGSGATSYTPGTGVIVGGAVAYPNIPCLTGVLSAKDINLFGATVKLDGTERKFLFSTQDLAVVPSGEDRVLFGGKVYEVLRATTSATSLVVVITRQLGMGAR
jgi:hypothetical protein